MVNSGCFEFFPSLSVICSSELYCSFTGLTRAFFLVGWDLFWLLLLLFSPLTDVAVQILLIWVMTNWLHNLQSICPLLKRKETIATDHDFFPSRSFLLLKAIFMHGSHSTEQSRRSITRGHQWLTQGRMEISVFAPARTSKTEIHPHNNSLWQKNVQILLLTY